MSINLMPMKFPLFGTRESPPFGLGSRAVGTRGSNRRAWAKTEWDFFVLLVKMKKTRQIQLFFRKHNYRQFFEPPEPGKKYLSEIFRTGKKDHGKLGRIFLSPMR
jgi:hypothetical protein